MKQPIINNIGALFDLDGVLLDTEGTYTEFWSAIDQRFPTGVPGFAQRIKGSNLSNILNTYFPGEALQREVTAMLDKFQADMEYRFFPGALDFLDMLEREGIKSCVVTSSDYRKMDAVYSQHPTFKQRFAAIVTGDMVSNPKPDPECFLLGAKCIGMDIRRCIVFEDSLNGLRAARTSGAKVVGLTTTCPAADVEPLCDIALPELRQVTMAMLHELLPQ